jgi:hypothetical protein
LGCGLGFWSRPNLLVSGPLVHFDNTKVVSFG